jgi:hypothetical protein
MPWFVASRPVIREGESTDALEYRVFSEAEIESISPEWDWASSACDSEEEAREKADDLFWNSFD